MSTYTDASLIYYPSGYKAGTAYSLKPTDGSGDLTFTRASTATRVNEQGLIEGVRTNLLTYSEQFDNAAWTTNSGASVTANTIISPDGTTNADTLEGNGTQTYIRVAENITVPTAGTYVLSIFAKAGTNNFLNINFEAYAGGVGTFLAYFDLINGTTPTSGASIEDYGNGWYRCISAPYTIVASDLNGNIVALATPSTSSVLFSTAADTNGKSLYLYGAQLELSASATEYIPTTTTAVSVGMLANVPRIDFTGGGCGKLLLEPQRTNILLQSEDISSASWTKGNTPTITSNIAIAPDGTTSADGIQSLTGGAYRNITQNFTVTSNSTVTGSVFVKKEISETFYGGFSILFQGGTTKVLYVIVDAVNGTGTVSGSTLTGTIKVEDYNNYWRISATTTDNGSNTICRFTYEATLSTNGTTLNVGAGSVRTIWGFQAELGSYATSYIPTTSTAVTRTQDSAAKSGISSLINSEEGVLYAEMAALADDGTSRTISLNNGSSVNRIAIQFRAASGQINSVVVVGGVAQAIMPFTISQTAAFIKMALKYKENDFALWVNGVEVGTDNSGSTFTASTINKISFGSGDGGESFYGNCQNLMVFPTALSDDDLTLITGTLGETYFESYALMANYLNYTIQ